jgi:hypothetical protein
LSHCSAAYRLLGCSSATSFYAAKDPQEGRHFPGPAQGTLLLIKCPPTAAACADAVGDTARQSGPTACSATGTAGDRVTATSVCFIAQSTTLRYQ